MQIPAQSGGTNTLLRKGVDFFYQKGATSPATAIEMNTGDWLYVFNTPRSQESKLLGLLSYIKKTPAGLYWIDMEEYGRYIQKVTENTTKIVMAMVLFTVVLLLGVLWAELKGW